MRGHSSRGGILHRVQASNEGGHRGGYPQGRNIRDQSAGSFKEGDPVRTPRVCDSYLQTPPAETPAGAGAQLPVPVEAGGAQEPALWMLLGANFCICEEPGQCGHGPPLTLAPCWVSGCSQGG